MVVLGEGAVSYERETPVLPCAAGCSGSYGREARLRPSGLSGTSGISLLEMQPTGPHLEFVPSGPILEPKTLNPGSRFGGVHGLSLDLA